MKDYLTSENSRNHQNHKVYEEFLRRATGAQTVVIGHHVSFKPDNCDDLNEIPSIDTALFCVELMQNAFGSHAKPIMLALCLRTAEERDRMLAIFLEQYPVEEAKNGGYPAAASG